MADLIGTVLVAVLWLMGIGFVSIIGVIIYMEKKYNIQVIIKEVHNGMKLTMFDKAKLVKKEDGTIWWKVKKAKAEIPPPPDACIEINNKGKKVIQLYRIDGGELIPAHDSFDLSDKEKTNQIISKIQPFTASQRQMLVNQYRKSTSKIKATLSEMIAKALPYMAMAMIVVFLLLFWGEAMQPAIEMNGKFVQVSENLAKTTSTLNRLINEEVTITMGEEINSPPINVTPPN